MRYSFSFFFILTTIFSWGQSTFLPLNAQGYGIADRWDIQSNSGLFTTVKPISRKYLAAQFENSDWVSHKNDKLDLQYLLMETYDHQDSVLSSDKPFLKYFFTSPGDLITVNRPGFKLHVNPVVTLAYGKDFNADIDAVLFENYRGAEIYGLIDDKVGFYTLLTENQARYPEYVQDMAYNEDSTRAVPYEGFWKQYDGSGVDFLRAQTYVDINATRHIGVQFGYGKHFIGDGKRSLILSDVGNNYPYLRLTTRVWKIEYTNIFAQLIARTEGGDWGLNGTGSFPKKMFANHHLSFKINNNITVGLFESVIQGDSTGNLSFGMFNPIIFYKAMEQQDGSAGNTILGADFKANLWKRLSLYGQLVIDELVMSEVFSKTGWWGNKQGFQLGAKYLDIFDINNLNGQIEINKVRPYLYAHESEYTSYSHYNMALAHPLGANFREVFFALTYRPITRMTLEANLLMAKYGNDKGGLSYGRDIMKSYLPENRPGDYNNVMFQGVTTDLTCIQLRASYMLLHNMNIYAEGLLRNESNDIRNRQTQIFSFGYRWNFPYRSYLF